MVEGQLPDVVALLCHVVDGLLESDLTAVPSPDLVGILVAVEMQRRRLDAVDVRLLAEVGDRGVAGDYGRTSTSDLLTHTLKVAPTEAKLRVAQARDLGPRRELSGGPLPPILPATAEALTAGDISTAHAAVIADCLDAIPPTLPVEASEVAERFLVQAARHEDPQALRRTAALLLARLDPEGTEPRDELTERRRGFTLGGRGDGTTRPSGQLTGETSAVWHTILDALSAPITTTDADANPIRDDRTPTQRRHDALLEAGLRLLRSGTLPDCGGVPVTVLIRATPADLATENGIAQTAHGDLLPTRRLLRLAGDTALAGVLVDTGGAVLDCGLTQRLATTTQRRALAARDGGCCFIGCTRPAAWCQVAHIRSWADHGPTDLTNLCLLCPHHHRLYDTGDSGWTIHMIHGIPHWRPPPWIDPTGQPIRNRAHHLPDIEFGSIDVPA